MRALLCFPLFWGLFLHCCGEPGSQKQWLNSVTPVITPLSTSNILWLVSIDETCQGIILNQWWVLSTARCLTKLKHLQYDISGFNDQENNFFGNKICLYPSFDPQMGTDSVKEDIGMVLLQYPLKRKMSLSHTYNFFRKSCYNCHPRHCRIYKYQNQHSFPTRIKKLAVKILDLSFCHHKQVHLSTSNNLCIQIQPQEDCWVQWGSPLLCHFGSHWKLIGLISESSVTCYDPILVIKTTPYLSWMRWIIKTSQKPLKPAFFLPCTVSTQVEHSTQDKLSMNRDSAIFLSNGSSVKSWRLNTISLNRKRRNSPVIFGSDIKDYFPDNRQLYVQSSQLHSVIKFPVVQSQIHSNKFPLYGQLSSRPWLKFISHVVPWTYSKADKTVMQIQPNEKSIRTQVHLLDDRITDIEPVTYTMHPRAPAMVNKLGFWTHSALLADVSHYPTVIHTLEPWFQPMLNVVGSQKVLDKTSDYLNVPQYVATQLQTSSATFMPFTWPLSVDTTLNPPKMESCPYCKSIITKHSSQMQIINTKIKHEFNILKTPQIQTEDKIRLLVNTISNILLPFSHTEFDFMRSWVPPEAELVKTWTSNPAGRPLTQLKDDIILPWFHPRIKRLRSWIQPKFQINRPMIQTEEIKDYYWTQSETYKMKPWTYNDMERIRHWSQLENIGRTWLLTKYDHMKPMTQTYLKTLHLWTQPDANTWRLPEIKVQSWPKPDASMLRPRTIFKMDVVRQLLQTQTDTVRTYSQPDFQTIFSLYDLEADRISPWLNTQMEAFKSCLETKIQTHSWPQPEGDITRLQPQFADDNVKLWFQNQIQTVSLLTETVTQTAYHWSQSETEIGRPWNQPVIDRDNWIHEAYKVGPWDEFEGEKSRFWIQPEADTMRPWMQLENGIINPWTQSESNTIISYAQDESSEEKFWTHSGNETIIPLTQMLAETVPTWTMAEFLGLNPQVYSVSDTFRLWTQTDSIAKNIWAQPVTQGEPSEIDLWTKNIANTATTWTQDESLITNTWTQSENDTVIPWIHPESLGINLWSQPIADVVTEWVQSEPSEIVFWTKVVSNRVIPMTQTEYLTANPWAQSEMDTTTLLTQAEFITINPQLNRVAGSITQWSHFESISVTSCVQTRVDTITLCIQSESPLYSWATYETNLVTTCTLAESLFFRPFETVSISTWTKKINPEINPWVQSETAIITTWIQAETSRIKSWIQHTIDTVAIKTQTESVEQNPWTEAEYVSVTAVTQLALLANSWTESISPMVIPWTRDTSSPTDLWLQSTIDLDILWTKTSYPGLNPWTYNIFQTHTDTSATNQWSKTFISSEQAEFSSVEIRGYPVSGQFTPLTQAESLTIDLWTESADLSAIFCPPPLIISCTVAAISKVTPMTQTESSPVINWSECTNNTVTLCTPCGTQIGKTSIAIVPGTLTLLDISAIMSVNLWSYSMTETITQWFQNESPVYTLEQSVSDYFRMLTQTIIVPVNPLTKPKAFAFTPRNKAESLEENMWTKFSSETISLETVKFYPVENHLIETMKIWTYSETGTVTFGIQAESPIAKTWTQSIATTQWTDSKSLSINMWTQPRFYAANPWIQYELPTVNVLTEFRSLAPTPSAQTEFSIDIPYTQSVSPSRISWTSSVTTTVILWTWIESLALNSWTISETDRGTHISSDDSLSLSFLKKCESDMGKMFPQIKSPVSLVTQNVVNKIRVWNHVEYLTSNYFPKTVTDTDGILDGSPTLSWTEDLTSAVTFWTDTKTNIENLWSLSNFEIETQIQSPIISPNVQSENSVTVRTLAESPAVNPWKQTIATTVTILTLTLSAFSQSVVSPVTSGAQAELSPLTQWSTSVASIIKPWTHTELKAINAHLESLVTAISTLPQADYVRVNPWPQSIASTVKYLTMTECPSVSLWPETVFFTFRQWIMTESETINTWTKPIFSTANPWIQDEFPMLTLWTTAITSIGESKFCAESPRENTCLETLVSLVTQWIHAEYSTANADTQAISSTVRSWDMIETQTLNFWTEMIASTVTPWTQTEYLRINSWTEAIDSIFEAWNKDEYSTIQFWTQTLPFTVTLDTQIESLSNPSPDTVVSTTILPWDRAESLKENIFITALMFKDTLWTHTLSSGINIWTKTLISTLFQGTQTLSLGYPLTLTTDDTLISRTQVEYVTVSSYLPTVMDRVLFWTVFKTESQKTLSLPEASIFDISLHTQSDTAVPLMKVKTQMSHPWTHQEVDNTWTLPISAKFLSWNIPLHQTTEIFPEPEIYTGLYSFKTQTEIMLPGAQSEFQIISTLTQFGSWRDQSMFQIQTISWNLTETSLFLPGNNSIRDTVQYWIFSEADKLGPWVQTKADMANTWTHSSSCLIRSCSQVELEAAKLYTESEINTAILLTQTEVYAVKQFSIYDSFMERPFFQPQIEEKRQSTKTESHIVTMWIQQTAQITQTKFQSETEIIEPLAESESQVDTTQTEAGRFYIPSLTDTIKTWTQLQTQLTYYWSQNEVSIINSWTRYEISLIRSWTKIQTDMTKPWISVADSTIKPWAQLITLEDHPSIQPEANTIMRHWLPTQVISVNHWIPLDALHSSPTLSETGVPPCLQTQSYITMPCIQPGLTPVQFVDPQMLVHLIQTETSINPSFSHPQINSGTDNPWIYPETQAAKPWTTVEANTYESWFRIQMTKFRPWTESQVFNAWTQANVDVIRSWIPADILAIMRTRFHSEDDISSFVTTQPNNVRMINLPETEIKHDTYFKTGTITSFASAVEPGGATSLLTSNFSSWSKYLPFFPVENILYSDQYFTTLSTEISALGCEDKINCLYPSKLTDISLFTLVNTSFPFADGARNFDNKLQVTETIDNSLSPSSCLSPHTPSFSLLIPCTSPYSNALSSSCSVFCPCTSISLFPSCSSFPPVSACSPIFLPLASCSNSLQAPSSSKLTMESIISPICSSLQASTTIISTKQTPMMPGSHSGTSTNQPEQNPPNYLELNVSLAECHLGVVWKESLQAFWLFKTAVISHETTGDIYRRSIYSEFNPIYMGILSAECGLRPGLIPHCPNCWEAEIGEFPWMVSIQLSFSHFCAGSILNERWILTTARCANFIKNSEALALVQVGLNDLQDPSQAQSVGIHRVMPYLGPKGPLGPGLIFLKQSLHFQSLVLPICLEETLEQEKNIQLYDCWLPSWSLMRGSPGILQKRHLSILQVINCAQFWPKLNEFTFCVEAKKAMGEAGCKGDLGAPLVCHLQQKDTWVQVGILTHFDEHCTKPYVFSQVSPFIFWLQGVTQPSHAPWSQQGSVTTSPSIYNPVSTSKNASAYTSTPAYIRPHFISLPQPQILADRISLRYAMPWQAMIISCGNQICSGSIVSSSWVLTAAHCVRNMNPEDTAVILGLRHPGAPLRVVKVSSILLHERFRLVSGAARNDLALLLLQEIQSPVQLLAPLGNLKNLNSSECWLSGPRILKPGDTDENPEMLQIQVMGASSCAHLYPDIGSSIVCFITQAKASDINLEPVSPGSAVMCRPVSGNGSWRQIGLTSLKALATVVSPHFSWILSASEKAGHPLNQAVMPWVEKPKSSSLPKQPTAMPVFTIIIFIVQSLL